MVTKKVYELDSYRKTHSSKILEIDREKNLVVLDETVFFPTGGGQDHDLGTLAGKEVLDVFIENDIIYHKLDNVQDLNVGEVAYGEIDFKRRYDFMCQHSGEHIISGVVTKHFGFKSVGFHIGEPFVRVDYDGYLDENMLRLVMNEANKAIADNHEIKVFCGTKEELVNVGYRSKKEIEGIIRVVDCGVDVCACCAPHVHSTIEVGSIICVSNEKYKRGSRLMLLAKERAYKYYNELMLRDAKLGSLLDSKLSDIYDSAKSLKEKNVDLERENIGLKKKLSQALIDVYSKVDGDIIFRAEGINSKLGANMLKEMSKDREGFALAFFGEDEDMSFILYHRDENAAETAKKVLGNCDYRGGGRGEIFQGKIKYDNNVKDLI